MTARLRQLLHDDRVRKIIAGLAAVPFLPIRPTEREGRSPGFTFFIDKAPPDDVALIRKAADVEADHRIQQFLAERWQQFLARLRDDLTVRRRRRPPPGRLTWLVQDDEGYGAALSAAVGTAPIKAVLQEARAYWLDRDKEEQAVDTDVGVTAVENKQLLQDDYDDLLRLQRAIEQSRGRGRG